MGQLRSTQTIASTRASLHKFHPRHGSISDLGSSELLINVQDHPHDLKMASLSQKVPAPHQDPCYFRHHFTHQPSPFLHNTASCLLLEKTEQDRHHYISSYQKCPYSVH